MRVDRLLLLGGLLLFAPGCSLKASKTLPEQAVPASLLARVGTVGDAPRDAVEIALTGDGRIVTEYGPIDLDDLETHLVVECAGDRWKDEHRNRTRDIVLRVDPSLPFEVVSWTLGICEQLSAYRVHFAVRPEEGEDEGAMALFLPMRFGGPDPPFGKQLRVRMRPDEAEVADGTAFAAYREMLSAAPDALVDLSVPPGVRAGQVLRTVDLLLRAGAKQVLPYGANVARPSGHTALQEYVSSHPAKDAGFGIRVGDREIAGGNTPAGAPPAVARVWGRAAGSLAEWCAQWNTSSGGSRPALWHWSDDKGALAAHGGDDSTENAIELGLKWLAGHQEVDEDGNWDCDDFKRYDPPDDRCDGPGNALHDVGVTGLALLAFLHAGYLDDPGAPGGRYAKNVRSGLRYLMRRQAEDGLFGSRFPRDFMYDHAIATFAVCEAFWRTRNPAYKKAAQRGLDLIALARNPYLAWRYGPRDGENDTSVTGWCVIALRSGKYAGLEVDPDAFEGARLWIDKMTDPETGKVGYNRIGGWPSRPADQQDHFPAERSQSMTAVGICCRTLLGEDPRTSEPIGKGAALCAALPPTWDPDAGSIDMYYWYFGTRALHDVGGESWKTWNEALRQAILPQQDTKGARAGSWAPIGVWGREGGRVYATALLVLCLDTYYRGAG